MLPAVGPPVPCQVPPPPPGEVMWCEVSSERGSPLASGQCLPHGDCTHLTPAPGIQLRRSPCPRHPPRRRRTRRRERHIRRARTLPSLCPAASCSTRADNPDVPAGDTVTGVRPAAARPPLSPSPTPTLRPSRTLSVPPGAGCVPARSRRTCVASGACGAAPQTTTRVTPTRLPHEHQLPAETSRHEPPIWCAARTRLGAAQVARQPTRRCRHFLPHPQPPTMSTSKQHVVRDQEICIPAPSSRSSLTFQKAV